MTLRYVLITPARNEAAHIELTAASVVRQRHRPEKWVVVNDGSTDATGGIVKAFCEDHPWIEVVDLPVHRDRHFAAKVFAFNAGYERVKDLDYDVIGSLDADISFDGDYFHYLLGCAEKDSRLGVFGSPFVEDGAHYDYRFTNIEHVSGACQLFRRECFEDIGGYVPIKGGGIDWTAVTTARMKGWKTRTFTEKVCYHHKKMGTGNAGAWGIWYRHGRKDYFLGGHPLWQLFRCVYQMRYKPYFMGGFLLFMGYFWSALCRSKRQVSTELMEFHRREQMQRLMKVLKIAGSRKNG